MGDRKTLERLEKLLRELGFTIYEARMLSYLSTMRKPLKVREISSGTNIPRTKVYEVADSLVERGFIELVSSKPLTFRSPPLNELPSLLVKELLEEFKRKVSLVDKISRLELEEGLWPLERTIIPLYGTSIIAHMANFVIAGAREFLILMTTRKSFDALNIEIPNKDVKIRVLVDSYELLREVRSLKISEIRLSRYDMFAAVSEQSAVISNEELSVGLYVSREEILSFVRSIMEMLFEFAVPIPR